jgi:DNA-binding CsgD family transcriptional regulator
MARFGENREITPLQKDILEAICNGHSHAAVAKTCFTTETYVSNALLHMRKRFNCRSTPQLIATLFRRGDLR